MYFLIMTGCVPQELSSVVAFDMVFYHNNRKVRQKLISRSGDIDVINMNT